MNGEKRYKEYLLVGLVILFINFFANILTFNILNKREEVTPHTLGKVIRATDHIFTALYYLKNTPGLVPNKEIINKIDREIESARKMLRADEVRSLRLKQIK